MDFSKLKVELYDFFGILLPGCILVCELWIAVAGWHRSLSTLAALPGTLIAALLLSSYVLGHLVQEAGDALIHAITHNRYLKRSRDEYWGSQDGEAIRKAIKTESGL